MMDFSGNDAKAKEIALHYAQQLGDTQVLEMLQQDLHVRDAVEAKHLARFYWAMLDQSALDAEQGVLVCGEAHSQYWMERLLNIIGGYLQKSGYGEQWQSVCDEM